MRLSTIIAPIALALSTAAVAAPDADRAISVETSDLNLTTEAGQHRLERRINTAVRAACRTGGRDLNSRLIENECRETALTQAKAKADRAVVMAKATAVRYAAATKPGA